MTAELLALYGEPDERLGISFKGLKKRGKRLLKTRAGKVVKAGLTYGTAPGLLYKGASIMARKRKRLHGEERFSGEAQDAAFDDMELAGKKKAAKKKSPAKKKAAAKPKKKKKFLPGLTKGIKKVGKVTSGFTTGIARTVGVPAPILKALSKIDPTKGKKASGSQAASALFDAETGKEIVPVEPGAMDINVKKIAIVGGGVVVGLIVLKVLLSSTKR